MKLTKALPVVLLCMVAGTLWIYLSDQIIAFFLPTSPPYGVLYHFLKVFSMACSTAVILYGIVWSHQLTRATGLYNGKTRGHERPDPGNLCRSLFQSGPVAHILLEAETGVISKVNPKAQHIFGYAKGKLTGQPVSALPLLAPICNGKPTEKPVMLVAYAGPDKRKIKLEASSIYVNIEDKMHLLLRFIDITERENAVDTLKEIQAKLAAAQKIARIGYWQYNFDTGKLFWSDEIYKIWDVDKQYFSPDYEAFLETVHPEDRSIFPSSASFSAKEFPGYNRQHRIVLADGTIKWVHGRGRLKKDSSGELLFLEGTVQDIDIAKKAELAAVEALREKEMVLERIGDAFFAVDQKWKVTYWNSRAEQILGRRRDEIINHQLWEVYPDAVNTPFYDKYLEAMETGQSQYFKAYYEGTGSWFEVGAFPSPTGLSIFFRDITEQVRYINSIEQYNKTLRDIAWSQSHEVRAPLTRLLGLAALVKDMSTGVSPELREIMDMMVGAVDDLDDIVKKINEKTNSGQLPER